MEKSILKTKNIDALLITQKENIGYLTNFWGSFGIVLITHSQTTLFTDSRYLLEAKNQVWRDIQVLDYGKLKNVLKKYHKVGYEAVEVTIAQLRQWQKLFPQLSLRSTQNVIENKRLIKTKKEIEKIKKAAQISDRILENMRSVIKIGMTEKALKWEICKIATDLGSTKMAFETTVCFGKNSAKPHHEADETKLSQGDLILIDLGAKFERYCSDITRVFFTSPPSQKVIKVFETVLQAQQKAIQKIQATKQCAKVDQTAREYIAQNGYAKFFEHALGHGVGLAIHESPTLAPHSKDQFKNNSVFTIEPGIYLPEEFGIRLEDLFVYQNKQAVQLSQFTKKIDELILHA